MINPATFRPMNDRILVRCLPALEKIGLLYVPDVAKDKNTLRGEVLAIGPGKRGKKGARRPLDVQVGEIVQFGKFTDYQEDTHGVGSLFLIQEADIRGKERA